MNRLYFLDPKFFIFDDLDKTEIMWSIIDNDMELFQALLNADTFNVEEETALGRSALHYAVFYNRYAMSKGLLMKGAIFGTRDVHGVSAALVSARMGHLKILQLLEDPIIRDDINGTSAASYAAAYKQNETLRHLCREAVPQLKDNFGYDVAHYAAMVGNGEAIKIVHKYRQYGTDGFDTQDLDGRSPMMIAVLNGNIDLVKIMLDLGWIDRFKEADRYHNAGDLIVDKNSMCALQIAAMVGNLNIIDLLIERGSFDVKRKDGFGNTAMLLSAQFGHLGTLLYLLTKGSLLDLNNEGDNALIVAVKGGNIFVVNHLVENLLLDVNLRNKKRKTALSVSITLGHDTITACLKEHGAII